MILSRTSKEKRKEGTGRGAVACRGGNNDKMRRRKMTARPPTPQLPPALLLLTGQPWSSQSSSASPFRTHAQVPMPKCNMQFRVQSFVVHFASRCATHVHVVLLHACFVAYIVCLHMMNSNNECVVQFLRICDFCCGSVIM